MDFDLIPTRIGSRSGYDIAWHRGGKRPAETTEVALWERMQVYRGALIELRLRMHAAGRRPEECVAMSIIDDALNKP